MAQKYDMISNIKYIPLRLSLEERRQFHLLVAALHVSEYVDKVDVVKYQRQVCVQIVSTVRSPPNLCPSINPYQVPPPTPPCNHPPLAIPSAPNGGDCHLAQKAQETPGAKGAEEKFSLG